MATKLEILHLRMIKAINDAGSVTKAADRLGLTQSALSHRIKEAERRLGTDLFIRQKKKLILTGAGERLLYSAELILNELENAEYQIGVTSVDRDEPIRIGTKAYSCYQWLPILKKFSHSEQGKKAVVIPEVVKDPLQALKDKAIDLAIVSHTVSNQNYRSIKLFQDEMVAVLPADHPHADKPFLVVEDFKDSIYYLHDTTPEQGREYDKFFRYAPVRPKKLVTVELTEAIVGLVDAGFGVTILTRWVLEPYLTTHDVVTLPLTEKGLYVDWHVVTRRGDCSEATGRLAAELKNITRTMKYETPKPIASKPLTNS